MSKVRCTTMRGDVVDIDSDSLTYRPAAYGFIVYDHRLATFRGGASGTRMLPGGKIEQGETATQALIRETAEEIGVTVISAEQLCFLEAFLYAEHKQQAYQAYSFFFVCTALEKDGQVVIQQNAETAVVDWISVHEVRPEDFHVTAQPAVRKFLKLYSHA